MKQLITLIFSFWLGWTTYGQTMEKLINDNAFKIMIKEVDFSYPHGIDPPREIILRKMYGNHLPTGSAFLYNHNGKKVLVTCMHVVERAKSMKNAIVAMDGNGRKYKMKTIGGDTFYDIAVLEFMSRPPTAKGLVFTNTPIKLEQIVKPTGFLPEKDNASIRKGIVSSRQSDFKNEIGGYGYWEMSLAIEDGMSGGAVLNASNKVIGINARVRTIDNQPTTTSYMLDGLIAQKAIGEILKYGRIHRAFLGIVFEQQKKTKDKTKGQVTIHSLIKGHPATAYKVLNSYCDGKNEIIVKKINQTSIHNLNDIYKALEFIAPRSNVKFTLSKNGKTQTFDIKTTTLEGDGLIKITNHYFANQKRYKIVKATKDKTQIEDIKKETTYTAIVAGNTSENAYYTMPGKQEIGVIIRLCSDLGSFSFLTWTENETIKGYNISNNNSDPRYTSYLIYF